MRRIMMLRLLSVCLAATFISCGGSDLGEEELSAEDLGKTEQAAFSGFVYGQVYPPMSGVSITTNGGSAAGTLSSGWFAMPHLAGTNFTLTARASGYRTVYRRFNVNEFGTTRVTIRFF